MNKQILRRDQRKTSNQLRDMQVELGVLGKADGSVKFSQGNTTVICSVCGPESSMKEKGDQAIIDVMFQPRDKKASEEEKEYELIIRQTLENVILTNIYPRTVITISIQVVQYDGCLLSASLNAASLALLDAGVAMKTTLVSSSCSYLNSGDCLLDPTRIEQDFSSILHNDDSSSYIQYYKTSSKGPKVIVPKGFAFFVFDSAPLRNPSKTDSDDDSFLVTSITEGLLTDEALRECISLAKEGALSVYSLIRLTLERKSTTPVLPTNKVVASNNFIKPKDN
ncbi:predicted protein [Naegleria gruberi]|uniref:Predicted protein n=1 Tax=Naegleria gruberi TaxID=5762 RepID=D2VA88_NAEGR|nr:uncharacterized protein NAEGRDRAFT_32409 [Naegleria gruberi]EFC46265.1 predicted protein [Naegleria gruberi]|eukprot:XP_002679009.1 predicted protein [Naegleria gruberi strain NEG-M]